MHGIWEFHSKKIDPGFTFEGPIPQNFSPPKKAPKTAIFCGVFFRLNVDLLFCLRCFFGGGGRVGVMFHILAM